MMRENADFRGALIEQLKWYCYVSDKIDELVEGGELEVSGELGEDEKMDEMAKNFAMLVKKEFPEEWENTRII